MAAVDSDFGVDSYLKIIGICVPLLSFLLYLWTARYNATRDSRRDEIERLRDRLEELEDDNRRLERENNRLMRLLLKLDGGGE